MPQQPATTDAAEALFVSQLQASDNPSPARVRLEVGRQLAVHGPGWCAAQVAGEFGDHPYLAAGRMRWALQQVAQTLEEDHA